MTWWLRLGAFDVALEDCPQRELIESLFRTRAEAMPEAAPVDLWFSLHAAGRDAGFGAGVALTSSEENGRVHFVSDVVAGHLDRGCTPHRLTLVFNEDHPHVRHLDLYLRIVLNAVLRRLARLRLHAAAVEYAATTSLFVGDKGAGKTTLSIHLAREGGTVLGEDQIMVRRTTDSGYVVAGGDGQMRVTAKTEAHFFNGRLRAAPVVVAGVSKKEILARDYLACEPHRESRLHRIFFPEMGSAFAIRPMSGRETLSRLAAPLLPINRFTSDVDRRGFIDFLAGMTRQAKCFSLTLTPELADLEQLSEFLQ